MLLLAINHDAPSYPDQLLSPFSEQLLVECAIRWRVLPHLRQLIFADCILSRFCDSQSTHKILFPFLSRTLKKIFANLSRTSTLCSQSDLDHVLSLLVRSEDVFRGHFLANFSGSMSSSSPEEVIESFHILESIYSDSLFSKDIAPELPHVQSASPRETLLQLLLEAVNSRYKALEKSVINEAQLLSRVKVLAKAIRVETNNYVWRYPYPLLGNINVAEFATSIYWSLFVLEMENLRYSTEVTEGQYTIAEILELYQIVRLLRDTASQDRRATIDINEAFDVETCFEPFMMQWVRLTDMKVDDWAKESVLADKVALLCRGSRREWRG